MQQIIQQILADSIDVKKTAVTQNSSALLQTAELIAARITAGRKILLFGNGGSAADAQHIAAEFINRFQVERPPFAALALTTDTSVMTSIGNDYGFDHIFAKQIRGLGEKDDIAWGISTSGNSPNVVKGLQVAGEAGLFTLAMTGRGGKACDLADRALTVPSDVTARIQETHITMGHILCELVDRILFPEKFTGH